MNYELKFDPKTIEHLGVKMYSTLPPALAELISNAYDADAGEVEVIFKEQKHSPVSITVKDNGSGMSSEDIQKRFLVIGRNRRSDDGDKPSPKYKRFPTGKKGLGKLALFGLAKKIVIDTVKDNKRNVIRLDWDNLITAEGTYELQSEVDNKSVEQPKGTSITLTDLKRKSAFNLESIADSLSRIFIVDDYFKIKLKRGDESPVLVTNERRYTQIEQEFTWVKDDVKCATFEPINKIEFKLITGKTPIKPSLGLRGITIFSRGKLVNLPEFFSNSTSSHFYQYLTGWVKADFIDTLDEDVIATNRQSINWEHEKMGAFREWLSDLITKVGVSWRAQRKNKKNDNFKTEIGIDKAKWFSSLPVNIKQPAEKIVGILGDDEGVDESFRSVIIALHEIIPEYPLLHWRHLHPKIREGVKEYYKNNQYAEAADQGTKVYAQILRDMTGKELDGADIAKLFAIGKAQNQKQPDILVADINSITGQNIQLGQEAMTRGVMLGFRNPMSHAPFNIVVPNTFSELDCLNILSLISYLTFRLDFAAKKPEA